MGLLSFLVYLRLKFSATIIRFFAQRQMGKPCPKPTSVLRIPSRDKDCVIKVHVYQPSTPPSGPLPVLLNFHGSGFVIPLHGSDDRYCREVVSQTNSYTVLDVQYRLSPEHPYPAALHDAEDALTYVVAHPDLYSPTQICLSGFSAGANLALALSSNPKNPNISSIAAVLAFYPPTNLSIQPDQKQSPEPLIGKNPIPTFVARVFNKSYIRDSTPTNPLISPLFFPDATIWPKNVLVITAGQDTLCKEGEELAERLQREGKKLGDMDRMVKWKRMTGVGHAWDKAVKKGSTAEERRDEAYGMAVEILKAVLSSRKK